MTEAGDEQDMAEALDSQAMGEADGNLGDEVSFPPDEPVAVDEYGLTSAEEQIPEPFIETLTRDNADPLLAELANLDEEAIRAALDVPDLENDQDFDSTADPDAGSALDPDAGSEVGRLMESDSSDDGADTADTEPDSVATAFEESNLSAEEAAVHRTADPPFHLGDGYVD